MAIATPAAPRLAGTNRPFPRMTWPVFDPRICPCPRGSPPQPMGIRTAQPAIPDVPGLIRSDPTLIPIDSCASIQLYHTPRPFCPAIDCRADAAGFLRRHTPRLPPNIRYKLPLDSPQRAPGAHPCHLRFPLVPSLAFRGKRRTCDAPPTAPSMQRPATPHPCGPTSPGGRAGDQFPDLNHHPWTTPLPCHRPSMATLCRVPSWVDDNPTHPGPGNSRALPPSRLRPGNHARARPSMAGPGLQCPSWVRTIPSARLPGWHILAPDHACPAVRGRAIHRHHQHHSAPDRAHLMTCQ